MAGQGPLSTLMSIAPMALAFIPGIGPIAAAAIAGGMATGQGLLSGQGPLTSLAQGGITAGTQFGFNKLGNAINPSSLASNPNAFGDASQFQMMSPRPNLLSNPMSGVLGGSQGLGLSNPQFFGGGRF